MKDAERAIALIGKTAVLEFRVVDESVDASVALRKGAPYGSEVLYQIKEIANTGITEKIPYLLKKEVFLTGDSLSDARVAVDSQYNEPYVSLTFDSAGGACIQEDNHPVRQEEARHRLRRQCLFRAGNKRAYLRG